MSLWNRKVVENNRTDPIFSQHFLISFPEKTENDQFHSVKPEIMHWTFFSNKREIIRFFVAVNST